MLILALNCGSSSLKSALVDTSRDAIVAAARVEEIGRPTCRLLTRGGERPLAGAGFEEATRLLLGHLGDCVKESASVDAVVHRVVHGGERFTGPIRLDTGALHELEALTPLAPLHNAPALRCIHAARDALGTLPHLAVFDTTFHTTLPRRARLYALPSGVAAEHGIRRFGFHGISHAHVLRAVAAWMHCEPTGLRIVSCHLGNGASATAIEYGRSVETSMGMTPLEGLVMGSRSGDLDPGVLLELLREGMDREALDELLNRQSGLRGLCGTSDMREIEQRAAEGDDSCRLAIALYAHRVRKYIGAYAAVMGGVDVIAFTGGLGENSALLRHHCLQRLGFLGAVLDEDRNREAKVGEGQPLAEISAPRSRTRLVVVKANEELAMARDAARLLHESAAAKPASLVIPVAVSARHAHLSYATIERLFGPGHRLTPARPLSQPGQFAAEERIALIGPRGRIDRVRLLGPARERDQVEISRSDEFVLGVDAPVRLSGDLDNTPGITLEGPQGRVTIPCGVIAAKRHIHMSPDDARRFGVAHGDEVSVHIDSDGRDLTFGNVSVRVSPEFTLELHLDTDEANAAGITCRGMVCELADHGEARVRIERS